MHEELVRTFCEFFSARGTILLEAEPVVPRRDESVLFTGATIVPAKEMLEQGMIPTTGLYISQPCVRTQNLKTVAADGAGASLPYMSCFHMLGTMVSPSYYEAHVRDILHLLFEEIRIPRERLRILGSSHQEGLLEPWRRLAPDVEVLIDTKSSSYYRWVYGMERHVGSGATFALVQEDGRLDDFGNVIQIETVSGVVAYEFGFGVETLLARIYGLPSPFTSSVIRWSLGRVGGGALPFSDALLDLIALGCTLTNSGVLPGEGGRNSVAKKTVKLAARLTVESDQRVEAVYAVAEQFAQTMFGSTACAERWISELRRHVLVQANAQDRFIAYLAYQRQMLKDFPEKTSRSYARQKIEEVRRAYHIAPQVAEELMRMYAPSLARE